MSKQVKAEKETREPEASAAQLKHGRTMIDYGKVWWTAEWLKKNAMGLKIRNGAAISEEFAENRVVWIVMRDGMMYPLLFNRDLGDGWRPFARNGAGDYSLGRTPMTPACWESYTRLAEKVRSEISAWEATERPVDVEL